MSRRGLTLEEQFEEARQAWRDLGAKIRDGLRDDPRQLVTVLVAVWLACLVLAVGTYLR